MCGYTRLASIVLLVPLLCCGVAHGQPKPAKYATIETGEEESIGKVRFSPTGDSLSYLISGKTIATWDVKTKQQRKRVHEAVTLFLDMDYSSDGRMLAVSGPSAVSHIDLQTGERTLLYRHDEAGLGVRCVRYSQDGKRIISAVRAIRVWDVEKKAEVAQIDLKGFVLDLKWIPGADHVLASIEESIPNPDNPNSTKVAFKDLLVDLKTREVKPIRNTSRPAFHQGSAFTRDGKLLASPVGEEVRVVSTATWTAEELAPPKCPLGPDVCLFSDSGRLVIVGGSTRGVPTLSSPPGEVAILDRASNTWVSHFRALDHRVTSMALSPNNDLLAVASSKLGTITVWDLSPVIESLPKDKAEKAPDGKRR